MIYSRRNPILHKIAVRIELSILSIYSATDTVFFVTPSTFWSQDVTSPSSSHQLFLKGWVMELLWESPGSHTAPDPQSPAAALLVRSGTTVQHSHLSFFHISNQIYQPTEFYWYCLHLLFHTNTLFHSCLVFLGFIRSQPSTKYTFHFADTLVNLFYFSSKILLKVLGIISK